MHVHHLALRTADLPRLEAFYRDLVGLPLAPADGRRTDRSVWLLAGPTLVMLERREAGEPPPPPGSMELVAFSVEPTDRTALEARLAGAGVVVEGRTDFTLYFRDPDGRRVGLSHFPDPRVG